MCPTDRLGEEWQTSQSVTTNSTEGQERTQKDGTGRLIWSLAVRKFPRKSSRNHLTAHRCSDSVKLMNAFCSEKIHLYYSIFNSFCQFLGYLWPIFLFYGWPLWVRRSEHDWAGQEAGSHLMPPILWSIGHMWSTKVLGGWATSERAQLARGALGWDPLVWSYASSVSSLHGSGSTVRWTHHLAMVSYTAYDFMKQYCHPLS